MSIHKPTTTATTDLDWEATSDLINQINSQQSVIPLSVIKDIMRRAGCLSEDPCVFAMVEAYVRRYLTEIIKEAQGYHMLTQTGDAKVMTREDLSYALRVFGIENHIPPYFASSPDKPYE